MRGSKSEPVDSLAGVSGGWASRAVSGAVSDAKHVGHAIGDAADEVGHLASEGWNDTSTADKVGVGAVVLGVGIGTAIHKYRKEPSVSRSAPPEPIPIPEDKVVGISDSEISELLASGRVDAVLAALRGVERRINDPRMKDSNSSLGSAGGGQDLFELIQYRDRLIRVLEEHGIEVKKEGDSLGDDLSLPASYDIEIKELVDAHHNHENEDPLQQDRKETADALHKDQKDDKDQKGSDHDDLVKLGDPGLKPNDVGKIEIGSGGSTGKDKAHEGPTEIHE